MLTFSSAKHDYCVYNRIDHLQLTTNTAYVDMISGGSSIGRTRHTPPPPLPPLLVKILHFRAFFRIK